MNEPVKGDTRRLQARPDRDTLHYREFEAWTRGPDRDREGAKAPNDDEISGGQDGLRAPLTYNRST